MGQKMVKKWSKNGQNLGGFFRFFSGFFQVFTKFRNIRPLLRSFCQGFEDRIQISSQEISECTPNAMLRTPLSSGKMLCKKNIAHIDVHLTFSECQAGTRSHRSKTKPNISHSVRPATSMRFLITVFFSKRVSNQDYRKQIQEDAIRSNPDPRSDV